MFPAAKALYVFLARTELGTPAGELGSILALHKSQVSRLYYRGRTLAREEDVQLPDAPPGDLLRAA